MAQMYGRPGTEKTLKNKLVYDEYVRNDFNELKDFKGGLGEIEVYKELKNLDPGFHVFCDLELPRQVDFVVVGRRGVFIFEVKKWSKRSAEDKADEAYKQADGQRKALYAYLKNGFRGEPPHGIWLNTVLVSDEILPDKNYKFVYVKPPKTLLSFIFKDKEVVLSDSQVKEIVSLLKKKRSKSSGVDVKSLIKKEGEKEGNVNYIWGAFVGTLTFIYLFLLNWDLITSAVSFSVIIITSWFFLFRIINK